MAGSIGAGKVQPVIQCVTVGDDMIVRQPNGEEIGFLRRSMQEEPYANRVYSTVPGCGNVVIGYAVAIAGRIDFNPYAPGIIAPNVPKDKRKEFWHHYGIEALPNGGLTYKNTSTVSAGDDSSGDSYSDTDTSDDEPTRVMTDDWSSDTSDDNASDSSESADSSSSSPSSSGYSGEIHRSMFDLGGITDVNADGVDDMGYYGGPMSRVTVDANSGLVRDYAGNPIGDYDPDSGAVQFIGSPTTNGYVDDSGEFHASLVNPPVDTSERPEDCDDDKDDDNNGGWSLFGSSDDDDKDDDDNRRKSWW